MKHEGWVPKELPTDAGVTFGVNPNEEFTPFGKGVIFEQEQPHYSQIYKDDIDITSID